MKPNRFAQIACLLTQFIGFLFAVTGAHGQYDNQMFDDDDAIFAGLENVSVSGASSWAVSEPYINLWIFTQPMSYQRSDGTPLNLTLAWKQRNSRPVNPAFGFGPGWECSWLGYLNGTYPYGPLQAPLGGIFSHTVYYAGGPAPKKEFWTTTTMERTNATFMVHKPSGAQDVYGIMFTPWYFLKQQIDPQGRITTFNYTYGNNVLLQSIVDYDSKTTTFTYDSTFPAQIAKVTDPYGRAVNFGYNASGRLSSITNAVGLVERFYYDGQGLITNLTTISGVTSFKATTNVTGSYNLGGNNAVNRSLEVTNPDATRELFVYRDQSTKLYPGSTTDLLPTSYPSGEVPSTSPLSNTFDNSNMDARNSFHWNALQFSLLSSAFTNNTANFNNLTLTDYKHATIKHWLRYSSGSPKVMGIPALRRAGTADGTTDGPKAWFDYAGKSGSAYVGTNRAPSFTAMLLPDANSRYRLSERTNFWEKPTREISTHGSGGSVATRTNSFSYAGDGIDLITATGFAGELVLSNAYTGYHEVATSYSAVNDRTDYSYRSFDHLLDWVHWPTGCTTTNSYLGSLPPWLTYSRDYDGATSAQLRSWGLDFYSWNLDLPKYVTDPRGLTVTNSFDNLRRPTTVAYPGSSFVHAYLDSGSQARFELQTVTDPQSRVTRLTYDGLARVCEHKDRCSHTTQAGYACGVLCVITNALGEKTTFTYDDVGRVIKVTYHDGSSATNRYDFLGQLTNSIDAAGVAITNYYNHQGLLSVVSNAYGRVLLNEYDLYDRVTNSVDANGLAIGTSYDLLGRVSKRTYPNAASEAFGYSARGLTAYTNRLGKVTTYVLDVLGRRTSETNPNGEIITYTYSAGGDLTQLVDGKNQTNKWTYDGFGRLLSEIDATGTTIRTNGYDNLGRLTTRWTPAFGQTSYTYNEEGNLLTATGAATNNYAYDALHRITVAGVTNTETHTFFSYTSFGASLTENGPWANDTITFTYKTNHLRGGFSLEQPSASAWNVTYGHDLANRLQTITDPNGLYTYSYSTPGSLRNKLSLPNGAYVTNVFDSLNRITNTYLKNSANYLLNSHAYLYNSENQRTKHTRTDGSYVDFTYDNIGQLKSALGKESGGATRVNEQFGFLYDTANNLNQRTNNALVQTFGVDSRNRLTSATRSGTLTVAGATSSSATSVTVNGSSASIYGDNTFAKAGVSLVDGNNTFTAIAQDSFGQGDTNSVTLNLPASVSFTYDADGNLTGDGRYGYSYSADGELLKVGVPSSNPSPYTDYSEFLYDDLRRLRIRRDRDWNGSTWVITNEVRYVYAGRLVVQERDINNVPKVTYTRGLDLSGTLEGAGGIGGLLARTTNSVPAYYHSDGHGNVTTLINGSQTPVAKYLYDPFGNTISLSGPLADANTYRFSSKEIHPASGLYYFGRRWYNPNLQRWMARDPSGMIDGPNLYAFVGNAPTYAFDPYGMETQFWKNFDWVMVARYGWTYVSSRWRQLVEENPDVAFAESLVSDLWRMGRQMSQPDQAIAALVQQAKQDYQAGGVGNVVNRVNPIRQGIDAYYGINTMKGPGEGDQLTDTERAVNALNAIGGTAGIVAGVGQVGSAIRAGAAADTAAGLRTIDQAGISASDALRIQNAADRTGQQITVVGSRAGGTAGPMSDWDYIFSGPSAARHSAASSVPVGNAGGAIGASGTESGMDIFQSYNPAAPGYQVLNPNLPHVIFTPKP